MPLSMGLLVAACVGWDTKDGLVWRASGLSGCNSKWLTQFQPSGLLKLSICARYKELFVTWMSEEPD